MDDRNLRCVYNRMQNKLSNSVEIQQHGLSQFSMLGLLLRVLLTQQFITRWATLDIDPEVSVTCLRSCLMKPEHLDWLDRIWQILAEIA